MLPDFPILEKGRYAEFLDQHRLESFRQLCDFVSQVNYGRNSSRDDYALLFTENCGTCSTKHGLLKEICELNQVPEIDLIVGIFLMNEEYSPKIKTVLEENQLPAIPEAHAYLRYEGKRYDFTTKNVDLTTFEPFLVREQSCDSHQLIDWKPMIHKHFMGGWLKRKNLDLTIEQLWEIREKCIACL